MVSPRCLNHRMAARPGQLDTSHSVHQDTPSRPHHPSEQLKYYPGHAMGTFCLGYFSFSPLAWSNIYSLSDTRREMWGRALCLMNAVSDVITDWRILSLSDLLRLDYYQYEDWISTSPAQSHDLSSQTTPKISWERGQIERYFQIKSWRECYWVVWLVYL